MNIFSRLCCGIVFDKCTIKVTKLGYQNKSCSVVLQLLSPLIRLSLSFFLSSKQLQQQAFLVLKENQVLIDQLEAQHVKAKANLSRHHSEGTD